LNFEPSSPGTRSPQELTEKFPPWMKIGKSQNNGVKGKEKGTGKLRKYFFGFLNFLNCYLACLKLKGGKANLKTLEVWRNFLKSPYIFRGKSYNVNVPGQVF
jgi:hypothetical protein